TSGASVTWWCWSRAPRPACSRCATSCRSSCPSGCIARRGSASPAQPAREGVYGPAPPPSLAWTGAWPAGRPVRQVGLQPDDVVGFLEPAAQLVIQIGAGLDHDGGPAPSRRVVDLLDDPGTVQQRCSREAGLEAVLARGQA